MNSNYNYIRNSILFDVYNNPKDSDELIELITKFIKEIIEQCNFNKSGKNHDLYKASIRHLLLNCVVSMITEKPIAISLNRNTYATGRLKELLFSYSHLTTIFKHLVALGWIEISKGDRRIQRVLSASLP
jgi:hypothetical protein